MARQDRPDFARLAELLRPLAYETRLELLHVLRFPRQVSEIRIAPRQVRPGENPARPMSRQSLHEHLEKLRDAGLVIAHGPEDVKGAREFVVNEQRLYQVMEEFRRVGTVFAFGASASVDATAGIDPAPAPEPLPGPKVVLVHGLLEGKPFPLDTRPRDAERGFVVGRSVAAEVSLAYDPYVSHENSVIMRRDGGFVIRDLASSRNGTRVNWRPVEDDAEVALRSGDVIGVGRSLLVFRSD